MHDARRTTTQQHNKQRNATINNNTVEKGHFQVHTVQRNDSNQLFLHVGAYTYPQEVKMPFLVIIKNQKKNMNCKIKMKNTVSTIRNMKHKIVFL